MDVLKINDDDDDVAVYQSFMIGRVLCFKYLVITFNIEIL